ncbi:hypothetical protein ABW21_db0203722 [Orbilia brochopaga]|nr:hypothetical protein ABW21_db0203722 [Drechslerella brochopaga]
MSRMPEYRRDSDDNIHIIYPANTDDKYMKGWEGYVPPRYTGLAPPVNPPIVIQAPREERILGLRRRTFWILLVLLILLVIGLAVGISVGVAMSIKKSNNNNGNASAQDANAGPTTATVFISSPTQQPTITPVSVAPTTLVITSLVPTTATETSVVTPTPTPINHCQQIWKGTAPFCNGKCDVGFTAVREDSSANACDESSGDTVIDSKSQPSPTEYERHPLSLSSSLPQLLSRVPHFRFLALFSEQIAAAAFIPISEQNVTSNHTAACHNLSSLKTVISHTPRTTTVLAQCGRIYHIL